MILNGFDRNQLGLSCTDAMVDKNSSVRIIDIFVDSLDLKAMRFVDKGKAKEGRPAYSNSVLLKLYIYGYLNRVRSSRRLQRESMTNIEAIWLIKGLRPCYKTISDFRKVNRRGFKKVFRQFNLLLQSENLFCSHTVAIDGSKFRAQNSMERSKEDGDMTTHF